MSNQEESVWDYPRPPKLELFKGHIRMVHHGNTLTDTNQAYRVLETSHPPTYYLPMADLNDSFFESNEHQSFCEFKGLASYLDLVLPDQRIQNVGWYYPQPNKRFEEIKNHVSFYASKIEKCFVNDELVQAQEGDFYGGWITQNIKGPFKGGPGTHGW